MLTPANVSLAVGGSQQFVASGKYSDGSTGSVTVTYGATGGTVTNAGLSTPLPSAVAVHNRTSQTCSVGTVVSSGFLDITCPCVATAWNAG